MQPTWMSADGRVTLYRADCLEVLPTLASGSVDALVTDPPYGVGFEGKATKHTVTKRGGYLGGDNADIGPTAVREALKLCSRAAVFPGNRLLHDYPKSKDIGCVYCPSGAGIGPWGFVCFHPVLFYGSRATNVLQPTSMRSFEVVQDNGHPCPKPLGWMEWILRLVSVDNERILDPFMGSGTTGIACIRTGRKFIGVEIDPHYFAIAQKRIEAELASTPLFDNAVPLPQPTLFTEQ